MGHDPGRAQSTAAPYAVALLASTVALALTFLVWPRLETTPSPLFFAAVVVSSCYGGVRPALLATALAALATCYFFVPPVHSLAIESFDDALRVGMFVLVAVLTGSLSAARRRAEAERGQQAVVAEVGRPAHVVGEAMTRKRAEEQRAALLARERAARAHAEAASRAKEDLLATVSHELRAPLAQLVTWSRLLRRGKVDETALEAIDRSTRTLERLAGDLLDVARITAGKLSLAIRPLVLGGTVSGALDALRVAAEAKGIALEEDLGAEPLQVLADPTRLQQVVWNLVGNAVKFTPLGGRILVRLRRVHGRARLTITDTGRGISAAFLPHVFEPFRQAGGTQQGLGLGLAIVRELVELHGGTVCAESAGEGRGARFTVILPLAPAATEALGGGSMTACAS